MLLTVRFLWSDTISSGKIHNLYQIDLDMGWLDLKIIKIIDV